ncbi:hypothetical protein SVAN01_03388 [Stagonosporopsis vannaccii]|nr:hypothetical protein SVAN01_03388 [Stagonosporopsis vannaccii]
MYFFAGVDLELCDPTPPPFPLDGKASCVEWLRTHALYLSLVSLSPRSLTPAPLQRALELCTSLPCTSDVPAPPVACPLDPVRRALRGQGRSVETQAVRCARAGNMWT